MAVLKIKKTTKGTMEYQVGFKYAVVGPGKFYYPFKTKPEAERWMKRETDRLVRAAIKKNL